MEAISLPAPRLDDDQVARYRSEGFVKLAGGFSPEDAARIAAWTDELLALPEVSGRHWVFHERSKLDPDRELVSRIEKIGPYHAGFAALSRALLPVAGQLLGAPAVLFKEKVNFKMAGGDGFLPHQDAQAGWLDYASDFVSIMVCIDPATVDNGCLEVATGGQHLRDSIYRAWEPLTDADMAGLEFRHVPTAPGDLLFFDCYVPHGSQPNRTAQMRRLYFATFNRLSEGDHLEAYYRDKHRNYPPDIDRDPEREYRFRV